MDSRINKALIGFPNESTLLPFNVECSNYIDIKASETIISTGKFAKIVGDEVDGDEMDLETAGQWARQTLNLYKVFEAEMLKEQL